jgi:hypothetical protein
MGYKGKLPSEDEIASLILGALRQDKTDAIVSAEIQAEIDQVSFKSAEKQLDKLSKPREVEIDTSKAEQKLKNLIEPLRDIERTIKNISNSGADFGVTHETIKTYERLKAGVDETSKSINANNRELKEAKKLIKDTDSIIKNLDITVEKATKKRKKNQVKRQATETKAQTEAIIEQTDIIEDQIKTTKIQGKAIGDVTNQIEGQTDALRQQTDAIEKADKAHDKLNKTIEKQLKLTRKRNGSGDTIPQTYTAAGGKYEITKGTEGWNLYEVNDKGLDKFITAYETLDELRKDSVLIAAQEAVTQKQLVVPIKNTTKARKEEAKATELATKAKVKYYEIDENAARISKQNRSFDDYKEGSATAAYKAAVDKMFEIVEAKKKEHPDKSEKLDQLLDRYAKNLATYINRDNQIGAQYPSVMISGAGNYNIKKHNKQMASWGKNYQYYEDSVLALENQIRTLGGGVEVIRGDEEDALEKLESKVEYMKYWHQVMVEANKYYRKNKSLEGFDGAEPDELQRIQQALADMQKLGMHNVPYPQYALTNDNQNIKRLEGRIAELKRLKAEGGKSDALSEVNDIYKLWVDKQDMRIRISFEMGKPDQEIIDMLRGKAFKWSPKNNAWQRQLTDNAIYDTKQLQKSLHTFYSIEEQTRPEQQIVQNKKLTSSYEGLADAVEEYVDASKKLWDAHDSGKDFSKLAEERNAAIEKIVGLFPPNSTTGISATYTQNGYRMMLQSQEMSRSYANVGSEEALKVIETDLRLVKDHIRDLAEKAQRQMTETAKLIGDLQTKYGDNFNKVFGKTIDSFGVLSTQNAETMYAALISKEQEYITEIERRQNVLRGFTDTNKNLISQYEKSESLQIKIGELSAKILQGRLSQDSATQQLSEYIENVVKHEQQFQQEVTETTGAIREQASALEERSQTTQSAFGLYQTPYSDTELKKLLGCTNLDSLLKEYNIGSGDRDAIRGQFSKFASIIGEMIDETANGGDASKLGILFTEAIEGITKSLMSAGSIIEEYDRIYEEFYQYMKGRRIYYTDDYKGEFGDDWVPTINKFRGVLTKDKKFHASSPDQLWLDLTEKFGEFFKKDVTHEAEQLMIILDTLQKARDEHSKKSLKTVTPLSLDAGIEGHIHKQLADEYGIIARNAEQMRVAASEAAHKEKEIADAAERTALAKQKQAEATKRASSEIGAEEIVAREITKALEQLRTAKDNATTLFSLKGVFDGDDLVAQAQEMVKKIAEQSNLKLQSFNVKDDTIKVKLYNDELKVTVDQMYKLRAATEDAESATLELVSSGFGQNVKALNENNFDVDGVQQRALAAIEKVRSSLHGLSYDLTGLESAAKNISSQDDFTKFNNQLKAAQDNIQAIKNATVTGNSMNPLANMQRDMTNANIEIETMRMRLEKLGDIQGVEKAKGMLEAMTEASRKFNEAQNAQEQQSAYNQYSNLKSQFKAQTDYIKAAKELSASQDTNAKKIDPIRDQYQSLLDIINKINSVNSNILKYQGKDGGSGLFSGYISQLQSEKSKLVSELQNITQEINSTLSGEFVNGKEYSIPFSNIISEDNGAISNFLNDTKTQASLTTEEIEKLVSAIKKSQNIDVEAAAKVTEQFKSVQETYKQIMSLTNIDKNNVNYQAIGGMFADIMEYKKILSDDPTQWSSEESAELQRLIDNFTKYGNILVEVGRKEESYFSSKTKYTQDTTMSSMAEDAQKASETVGTAQQKLTEAANKFAKESGASGAIVTKFVTDANGISKLDFSVLDKGTNTMRKFSMEMGSVSQGIYITENTLNSFVSKAQQAINQLNKVSDLIANLKVSGIDIDTSSIQKLVQLQRDLNAELTKGDNADQDKLSELARKAQVSYAEVNKLYKQWVQLQNLMDSGDAINLGGLDKTKTTAEQAKDAIQKLSKATGYTVDSVGKFNTATGKLKVAMTDANGNVHEFILNLKNLGNVVVAQETGIKEYASWWDRLKDKVGNTGKQLLSAFAGANVFYKAISEIRKGYNYVKELDLAMTELKKVTNETTESYEEFLDAASKTASIIGSTVTDFTNATANFARLGYSIESASQMAEAAIVYKNVADGLDTVDEATESIISTMKAFGIEANDVMSIIDRYNEVGK